MLLLGWAQIRLDALLLLEECLSLTVLLCPVLCFLVAQLVVNLDLLFGHFDIILYNTDFLLLLWPLKAKVHLVSFRPFFAINWLDRLGLSCT